MTASARRRSPPSLAVLSLALAALVCAQAPAASQSSSVPPASTAPGTSMAPIASTGPIDVGSLRWKQSKKSKGFGPRDGSPNAFDIAVGPTGRFVMVGVDGEVTPKRKAVVWGSDDGVRWTKLKGSVPKRSSAFGVIPTGDGFLIVGDVADRTGPLLLTSDGSKVARVDAPAESLPTGALYGIADTPIGLVAAGADGNGVAAIWTSPDGVAWTGASVPDAFYINHVAVTDDGTLVVLGNQGDPAAGALTPTAWSSTDGVTWIPTPLPVDPGSWSVPDLERTPAGLLATVSQGRERGLVFLSTDGATWTQVLEVPGVATAGTAGTEAIVFGPDAWWHSVDATTWTEAAAKAFDGYRIETSAIRPDGAVIAAGYIFSGPTAMEPMDSVRTWVGAPPAP